ncbi:MAG: hypothetical protein GYB67_03105, partial [Chloroflexi bacterium]|nr:hypothetical protein [Chloroflexota bacterium]
LPLHGLEQHESLWVNTLNLIRVSSPGTPMAVQALAWEWLEIVIRKPLEIDEDAVKRFPLPDHLPDERRFLDQIHKLFIDKDERVVAPPQLDDTIKRIFENLSWDNLLLILKPRADDEITDFRADFARLWQQLEANPQTGMCDGRLFVLFDDDQLCDALAAPELSLDVLTLQRADFARYIERWRNGRSLHDSLFSTNGQHDRDWEQHLFEGQDSVTLVAFLERLMLAADD